MRPRPDTRGASFGDRYLLVLVTACPWVWSTFLRRCVQAGAEVMVYTCPISARAAVQAHEDTHHSHLVTVLCPSIIEEVARYIEGDDPADLEDRWTAPVVAYTWGQGWPVGGTDLDAYHRAVVRERLAGTMTARTLCPLPPGHDGDHAEALAGDDTDTDRSAP